MKPIPVIVSLLAGLASVASGAIVDTFTQTFGETADQVTRADPTRIFPMVGVDPISNRGLTLIPPTNVNTTAAFTVSGGQASLFMMNFSPAMSQFGQASLTYEGLHFNAQVEGEDRFVIELGSTPTLQSPDIFIHLNSGSNSCSYMVNSATGTVEIPFTSFSGHETVNFSDITRISVQLSARLPELISGPPVSGRMNITSIQTAVPEPASFLMLTMGGAAAALMRRRRVGRPATA